MTLPRLATRLLLLRSARWTGIALAATALLVVLVDWVEHGSRVSGATGGSAVMESLRLALLLLPSHLSRGLPVVVALGAALTVVGLRRSGEWQALAAAGLSPARLLAPLVLLGALAGGVGAAMDAWLTPVTSRAHSAAMATHQDRPLRQGTDTWLAREGWVYRLAGEPSSGTLGPVSALALPDRTQGTGLSGWQASAIRWDGARWISADPGTDRPVASPAPGTTEPPWALLPGPDALAALIGPEPPSALSWGTLRADPRPSSSAEAHGRGSRPLVAPLAVLVAAALTALLAPGSLAVLLAAAPVLAWEIIATIAQSQAAMGHIPPAAIPALRLGLALVVAALVLRRLRRP